MQTSLDALADQRGATLGRAGFVVALVAIFGLFILVTMSGPPLLEALIPNCRGNACGTMSHLVIRAGCFALLLAGLAMAAMPRARDAALPAGWGLYPALMILADHAVWIAAPLPWLPGFSAAMIFRELPGFTLLGFVALLALALVPSSEDEGYRRFGMVRFVALPLALIVGLLAALGIVSSVPGLAGLRHIPFVPPMMVSLPFLQVILALLLVAGALRAGIVAQPNEDVADAGETPSGRSGSAFAALLLLAALLGAGAVLLSVPLS